uniref:Rhodanese domain-containing protein n=1 Tax=Alexandrium monilatum TaxID=311494 RepID=A0A7S4Q7X6_9DINO|mmetsp:Transcript_87860/g.261989  ORF Transcript_87860/g.261989 Transcript_87860/m.261989 type:complete len:117 (-) Transcript_87860:261-611(-)
MVAFQESVKWDDGFEGLFGKEGLVLLDVRNPGEVEEKPHDDSVNVPCKMGDDPSEVMKAAIDDGKIPSDVNAPIIVFCAVGGRSARAVEALRGLGYKQVMNGGGADGVKKAKAAQP